jgi:hypothetical protein
MLYQELQISLHKKLSRVAKDPAEIAAQESRTGIGSAPGERCYSSFAETKVIRYTPAQVFIHLVVLNKSLKFLSYHRSSQKY